MTGPQPGRRRRGTQGNNGQQEQLRETINNLRTASEMLRQTVQDSANTAQHLERGLEANRASMDSMLNFFNGQFGSPVVGPGAGDGPTPGGGRRRRASSPRPRMDEDQTDRTNAFPDGAYPGGGTNMYGQGTPSAGAGAAPAPPGGWGGPMAPPGTAGAAPGAGQGGAGGAGEQGRLGAMQRFLMGAQEGRMISQGARMGLLPGSQGRMGGGALGSLGRLAGGGGMRGAIAGLGEVGGAVAAPLIAGEAALKIGNWIGQQSGANAQYQSILGGSNMAGLGQRISNVGGGMMNDLRNLGGDGGLPGDQYDAAFKGITAMGYQGSRRGAMMDYVRSNYSSMGMTAQDSMGVINFASQNATSSLKDLTSALQGVSDMAKRTQQNANVLRASLMQNVAGFTQAGYGQQSARLGQAVTGVTAGAGRAFAGVQYTGQASMAGRYMLAAGSGMSPAQMEAQQQLHPNSPAVLKAMQGQVNNIMNVLLPNPSWQSALRAEIEKEGGASKMGQDPKGGHNIAGPLRTVTLWFMSQGWIGDAQIIKNVTKPFGWDLDKLDSETTYAYLVWWFAQNIKGGKGAHKRSGQGALIDAGNKAKEDATNKPKERTDQFLRDMGVGAGDRAYFEATKAQRKQMDSEAYGQRQALEHMGMSEKQATDALRKAGFKIPEHPLGPKDILPKQPKSWLDKTLGKKQPDPFTKSGREAIMKQVAAEEKKSGKTGDKGRDGAHGTVTMKISPEMAKLFNIQTSGNIVVEGGASKGAPPAPRHSGSSTGR